MKALLLKDLRLMMGQTKFLVTVVFVVVVMGATMSPAFLVGYAAMMGAAIAFGTLSYDEFEKGYSFLFTLPVGRRMYVGEKYVLLPLVSAIFCVLPIGIVELSGSGDAGWKDAALERFLGYFALWLVILLIMGVMIPIQIKFGVEKSRTVMYVIYGVVAVGVFLIVKLTDQEAGKSFMLKAKALLEQIGFAGTLVLGVLCVAALYGISMVISMKIMCKKEF